MTDLIERIESAKGPSRELDAEIAPLVGLRVVDEGHPIGRCFYDKLGHGVPLPSFTASIDAALTLVPEGLAGIVSIDFGYARLEREDGEHWSSDAATPALALVAAALRARGEQP